MSSFYETWHRARGRRAECRSRNSLGGPGQESRTALSLCGPWSSPSARPSPAGDRHPPPEEECGGLAEGPPAASEGRRGGRGRGDTIKFLEVTRTPAEEWKIRPRSKGSITAWDEGLPGVGPRRPRKLRQAVRFPSAAPKPGSLDPRSAPAGGALGCRLPAPPQACGGGALRTEL